MATEGVKRKTAAVLSADVVGYSLLMEEDEEGTVRTLESYREAISALIRRHSGRVVDTPGDNLLSEFAGAVDAVQCAMEIQAEVERRNADLIRTRRMEFRIGINLGQVIEARDRIYGENVIIAARIEELAEPGGICISGSAHKQVESKLDLGCEDLGEYTVKNISRPVKVYKIPIEPRHRPGSTKDEMGPAIDKPSIAVLAFRNMTGDPDQDYFSNGFTEAVLTGLSMNPMLTVAPKNATFHYRAKEAEPRQIGGELGVRYVVGGGLNRAGDRIRITAHLTDTTTQSNLWDGEYDRESPDIFYIRDDIVQQIAASTGATGTAAGLSRVSSVESENLSAVDLLWRAREIHSQRGKEANVAARELCERASDLDPNLAQAYEITGATYLMDYVSGWSTDPRNALSRVHGFAQKALSLDTYSPGAHGLLAFIYAFRNQENRAIAAIERAISIASHADNLYADKARILVLLRRQEDAIGAVDKAMHLNPHYPGEYAVLLGEAHLTMGRHREAIASLREALEREPDLAEAYCGLATSYRLGWSVGQDPDQSILDQALEAAKRTVAIDDSHLHGHLELCLAYLLRGQHEQAVVQMEGLIASAPGNGDGLAAQAVILNSLERAEEGIEMVESAMQFNPVTPAWYLHTLASSYSLTGRDKEAVDAYKSVFERNPSYEDAFVAHLGLAIMYVELGQEEEGRAEASEVLRLSPHFSVELWGQRNPNRDRGQTERGMAALRKAGLK